MARRTNLKILPRKRYLQDKSLPKAYANVAATSVVHQVATTHVQINFSSPVNYVGATPPQTWSFKAQTPIAYISQTPTSCIVSVAAAVIATDPYVIAAFDPAIRTQGGGFVTPVSGAVS